jgi:hypothetical protein
VYGKIPFAQYYVSSSNSIANGEVDFDSVVGLLPVQETFSYKDEVVGIVAELTLQNTDNATGCTVGSLYFSSPPL